MRFLILAYIRLYNNPCTSPGQLRDNCMIRNLRSGILETRSARLKLARRGKPYWTKLARGLSLGYRRIGTAGPWIVRPSDGKGGNRIQNFAIADDYEEANGDSVLTFWRRKPPHVPLPAVARSPAELSPSMRHSIGTLMSCALMGAIRTTPPWRGGTSPPGSDPKPSSF